MIVVQYTMSILIHTAIIPVLLRIVMVIVDFIPQRKKKMKLDKNDFKALIICSFRYELLDYLLRPRLLNLRSDCENNLTNIDETAMLTFLTETKNGEFGVISTTASQLPRIEVRREDAAEPGYYYSFQ